MLYLQFLGSIIRNNDIDSFDAIQDQYLIGEELIVYKFFKEFIDKYGTLPSKDTLKSKGIIIPLDRECADPPNYYVNAVVDRYKLNLIKESSDTINEKIGDRELDSAVVLLQDLVSKLSASHGTDDVSDIVTELKESLEDYRNSFYNPVEANTPLTLGFDFLDNLNGGAYAGNLIGILARPAVGKTSILLHILLQNWKAGFDCLIGSGEMTKRELVDKLGCYEAGLDCNKYLRKLYDHFRIQKIENVIAEFERQTLINPIRFLDPAGSLQDITIRDIERYVSKYRPKLLCVDAVYLFEFDHKQGGKQNWDKVSKTLNGLKAIARKYNTVVICTGQLGKQAENKKGSDLDLTHAGDTDTWAKICNMVIGITKGEIKSSRKIVVLKNRIGPGTGDVYDINYKPESYDFSNFLGRGLDSLDGEDAEKLVYLD